MNRPTAWICAFGLVWVGSAGTARSAEFHVSPNGSNQGDGSAENPWDLATALSNPPAVTPGDTLFLHGGVYPGSFTSQLTGEDSSPIVVRAFEGQWPVIDGGPSAETTLTILGAWTWYWGFEVTNTEPDRWGGRSTGLHVAGPNVKLINLILHDLGNNGFWTPAENLEIYGCLIYHTGYDDSDRGHGHGVYTQNETGTKRIEDNIIFGGYSYGIHAYTENGSIQGFDIIGNTWFSAGVISSISDHKDDCLVGGLQPAARILLRENMSWAPTGQTRTVRLGYSASNEDVTLTDNYFVGETRFGAPWNSVTMTGNTFYQAVQGVDPAVHPDNTYLGERPAGTRVFVRANRYEPGRAHITVYNWDGLDSVEVDLTSVLGNGAVYEIRDAQNFFQGPVADGVYRGGTVSVPMTGLWPAEPVGTPGRLLEEDHTYPDFGVFVLLSGDGVPSQPPGRTDEGCSCNTAGGAVPVPLWLVATVLLVLGIRDRRRAPHRT